MSTEYDLMTASLSSNNKLTGVGIQMMLCTYCALQIQAANVHNVYSAQHMNNVDGNKCRGRGQAGIEVGGRTERRWHIPSVQSFCAHVSSFCDVA